MQRSKNWVEYLQAAWEGFFEEVEKAVMRNY